MRLSTHVSQVCYSVCTKHVSLTTALYAHTYVCTYVHTYIHTTYICDCVCMYINHSQCITEVMGSTSRCVLLQSAVVFLFFSVAYLHIVYVFFPRCICSKYIRTYLYAHTYVHMCTFACVLHCVCVHMCALNLASQVCPREVA